MHNWGPIFSRPVRICVPTGDFVDDQLSDVDEDDMGAEVNRLQSDEEEDEDADAEEEEEALQYGRVNEPLIRDHPGWQKSPTSIKNKIQPGKSVIDFFFMVISSVMIDTWVAYTNANMDLHFAQGARRAYGKRCPPVERREILALLGIFLIMGIARIRCIRDAYRYAHCGFF